MKKILIVGLGNPGEKYADTRHNLGFMVLNKLGGKGKGGKWKYEEKFKSEILNCILNAVPCILVKPRTYMNDSGLAVLAATEYFQIKYSEIIVVHDELDLPLGSIQIKNRGGAGGHHGVESLISALGTDQFTRIRVGIGPSAGEAEKFVLKPFAPVEKPAAEKAVKKAAFAAERILEKGLESAQNQFN